MFESSLLHELIALAASRAPGAISLTANDRSWTYSELDDAVHRCAAGLLGLGIAPNDRVGIFLEKCFETAVVSFGAPAAGGAFVPLNPVLRAEQVAHILPLYVYTSDRVVALSLLGPQIVDRSNSYKLLSLFKYSDDRDKAQRILDGTAPPPGR